MSTKPEQISESAERSARPLSSAWWMVGAVVAGCVLLGISILDTGVQEPAEAPAAAVAEPVAPATVVSCQSVSLQVGQKREVLLNSDSCSGNVWQLAGELPADSPVAATLDGVVPDETNCCGFPVPVTLTISALKPGKAELRLIYARPQGEDKSPARQEVFSVSVTAAAAAN